MKKANSIKALLFLVSILFSFSTSAYNSLKQFPGSFDFSLKKANYNACPDNNVISDNILSEELENENNSEDFTADLFLILPFSPITFNAFKTKTPYNFSGPLQKTVKPIFISVCSLRI